MQRGSNFRVSSYGGFLEAVVGGSPSANTNNPGLLRLVEGLVFPVGLTLIVLTGMELLTSDMMIIELGVFKRRIPWWGIPYNWVVVCKSGIHFGKVMSLP